MTAVLLKAKHYRPSCDLDLWLKCDFCGKMELVYENQSDRLLIHDYIKENGWRTFKAADKWYNICPSCIKRPKEMPFDDDGENEEPTELNERMNKIEWTFYAALLEEIFFPKKIEQIYEDEEIFTSDRGVDVYHSISDYHGEIEEIVSQWPCEIYKADFMLKLTDTPQYYVRDFIVEIDGHDYHKTKKQRHDDYERERFFLKKGFGIIRFTGSEVYVDARRCARETLEIVEKEGKMAKETFMDYHHGEFRYIYGVANGTKKRKDIIDFLHERYSAFEKWRCEQGYEA